MNGDNYAGWFVNGAREGHGSQQTFHINPLHEAVIGSRRSSNAVRRRTLGTVYLGDWKADKREGFGVEEDVSNGSCFFLHNLNVNYE